MDRKSEPTKYERQSRERISYLITKYCDGSQQQLADKTGVGKASISQYINGKNVPSNITAKKLCKPFGINPAWIMGFDVPRTASEAEPSSTALNEPEEKLLTHYRNLNEEGQEKLVEYAEDLEASGRYIKNNEFDILQEEDA